MTFGSACRILFERSGMSQADFCRASGLSTAYTSMLLSGKVRDPSFEKACVVADALGVTLEDIRKVMFEEGGR